MSLQELSWFVFMFMVHIYVQVQYYLFQADHTYPFGTAMRFDIAYFHRPFAFTLSEETDKNHPKRRSTQTIPEEEPEDGSIGDVLTYSVDLYKSVPVDAKRRKSSRPADIAAGVATNDVGPQQHNQTPAAEQTEEEIPPIFMDFVIIQSMNITAIYEKV
jgi:hypothetical protein